MIKRASGKIQVLNIDGSEVHAVMPDASTWGVYTDALFDRDKEGNLKTNSGKAIEKLYADCVKKLVNVLDKDGNVVTETVDTKQIVDILRHIDDIKVAQKIDSWLLNLGDLTKEESKNLPGEQSASSL